MGWNRISSQCVSKVRGQRLEEIGCNTARVGTRGKGGKGGQALSLHSMRPSQWASGSSNSKRGPLLQRSLPVNQTSSAFLLHNPHVTPDLDVVSGTTSSHTQSIGKVLMLDELLLNPFPMATVFHALSLRYSVASVA